MGPVLPLRPSQTPAAKILGLASLGDQDLTTAFSNTLFVAVVQIEIPREKTVNSATWADLTLCNMH